MLPRHIHELPLPYSGQLKPSVGQTLDDLMPTSAGSNPRQIYTALLIRAPTNRVGTLTTEERRLKLQKYLEKRSKRTFHKRISYHCRKQVADNRLRVKGRFVTKQQAVKLLKVDN